MTERLYYNDSKLLEFDSVISEVQEDNGRFCTYLESSAFYPTSGGQSHDTGHLNDTPVVDVVVLDDGRVGHITESRVGRVGDTVHGRIDKERRLRNSQNHTAQHLLSAAFDRLYDLLTVSVHLGDEYGAVELAAEELTLEQLAAAEEMANEVVHDNIPVETIFVDHKEAAELPLRKPPPKEGRLRVIRVGDYECSACGGTHCNTTGGVGLIKIIGTEKLRGHTLVKFLTGRLALGDYRMRFDVTDELSRRLTCHPGDLPQKFTTQAEEIKSLRRSLAEANRELMPIIADRLAGRVEHLNGHPVIWDSVTEQDVGQAGKIASLAADRVNGLAVLVVDPRLVIAAAARSGLHAGQLARGLAAETDLKGGGNNRLAQLGVVDPSRIDEYRQVLSRLLADE